MWEGSPHQKQLFLFAFATILFCLTVCLWITSGTTWEHPRFSSLLRTQNTDVMSKDTCTSGMENETLSMDFPWLSDPSLPRIITSHENREYLDLMEAFAAAMDDANVTYIMYFGTLLGSYRMHNILPWDDDVDIVIRHDDMCKVIEAIQNQENLQMIGKFQKLKGYWNFRDLNYKNVSSNNLMICGKVFTPSGVVRRSWRWPFLDIWPVVENTTHMWFTFRKGNPRPVKLARIYPLTKRPLGRLWLPAPQDSDNILHEWYGDYENQCEMGDWNHHEETALDPSRRLSSRCHQLRAYYPYVLRQLCPSYTIERLMFKNDAIHSVVIH